MNNAERTSRLAMVYDWLGTGILAFGAGLIAAVLLALLVLVLQSGDDGPSLSVGDPATQTLPATPARDAS